jgi:hypothetical protein
MNTGICKLCKEEKELLKKSHIVPDFIYKLSGMFDDKHRIHTFDPKEFLEKQKVKKVQSGIYESDILCQKCDNNVIGTNYESYARKAIYGGALPESECPECDTIGDVKPVLTICRNVDYRKYKLFLLSVLWRSHHCTDEFFNEIKLQSENEERIRNMILSGNPGEYNDFPVCIATFAAADTIPPDLMITPHRMEAEGLITHTFIFGGMVYLFFEGLNIQQQQIEFMVMRPDNILKVYHFNDKMGWDFLLRFAGFHD